MNWGRYAEIFDYDRENGRLVLTEVAQAEAAPVAAASARSTPAQHLVENQKSNPTLKPCIGKPTHEEEHHLARIFGVPAVVAAAEHRNFAPARRHHVRRRASRSFMEW